MAEGGPGPSATPTFQPELIQEVFRLAWERERAVDGGEGTAGAKMHKDAANLGAELVRLFIVEAVSRAAALAEVEGDSTIEPSHLERILPQLLLDF